MTRIALHHIHIRLVAQQSMLFDAWQRQFQDCEMVEVVHGDILAEETDTIVSPANSFGYMDGGLDLALSLHFGWHLEKAVRSVLLKEYDGELPVGQAIIVPTQHEQIPWLVSAPTMRVPMVVKDTVYAYLAFRAMLRALDRHNSTTSDQPIRSIACPGLGTGEGQMPAERCARQMRYAYDVCVEGHLLREGGLASAARNHMWLIDYEA